MPGFDHFGWFAPYYERFIRTEKDDSLIQFLKLPIGGRLLDVGGGTGRVAEHLTSQVDLLVVADISIGMLLQAQRKPDLNVVCSASEFLAFPDQSFERVIIVDAFHHVIDQQGTANELWRVLKPGGRLVIQEPDICSIVVKLIALGEKILMMRSHFLSPGKITDLFLNLPAATSMTSDKGTAWIIVDKPII